MGCAKGVWTVKQIIYAMQFKGSGGPVAGSSNVLRATMTCPSCTITSVVGPGGVSGSVQPASGGRATFESQVTLTGKTSFKESGTIAFGERHRLRFSTVGEGYLGPSPTAKQSHGSVMWKVEGGEGQFEGATGLITSNFTFTESGEVVDNQLGVIYIK